MPKPNPSAGELAILRVLWEEGPATVREVHEHLASSRNVGYTTVLKLLQIMTQKGLVHRDEENRAHVYAAAVSEHDTQRSLVRDLLDKAFLGSSQRLVLSLLESKKASRKELDEIRSLLDEYERKGKKS